MSGIKLDQLESPSFAEGKYIGADNGTLVFKSLPTTVSNVEIIGSTIKVSKTDNDYTEYGIPQPDLTNTVLSGLTTFYSSNNESRFNPYYELKTFGNNNISFTGLSGNVNFDMSEEGERWALFGNANDTCAIESSTLSNGIYRLTVELYDYVNTGVASQGAVYPEVEVGLGINSVVKSYDVDNGELTGTQRLSFVTQVTSNSNKIYIYISGLDIGITIKCNIIVETFIASSQNDIIKLINGLGQTNYSLNTSIIKSNLLIGENSGLSLTGKKNLIIGNENLYQAINCNNNVILGDNLFDSYNIEAIQDSVVIGQNTIDIGEYDNTRQCTGSVLIGKNVQPNRTCTSSIVIGKNSLDNKNSTLYNLINIGIDNVVNSTNPPGNSVILGSYSLGDFQTGGELISIGNNALTSSSNVVKTINIGNGGFTNVQSSNSNINIGHQSFQSTVSNNTSADNIILGNNSLSSLDSSVNKTIVIGNNTFKNVEGAILRNIVIGDSSSQNVTGITRFNIIIGNEVSSSLEGQGNIAIGDNSFGSTINSNFIKSNNTVLGRSAFLNFTQGLNNIAIGFSSASGKTSGSDCIYIGANTNASGNNTNEIMLGNNITGLGNNSMLLGNPNITKTRIYGNVGIGTDNPTSSFSNLGSQANRYDIIVDDDAILNNNHYYVTLVGGTTLTLPDPTTCENRVYVIHSRMDDYIVTPQYVNLLNTQSNMLKQGWSITLISKNGVWNQVN